MSILFCTPCYGNVATTAYLKSIVQLQENLLKSGLDHDFLIGGNESLITRARNEMTATFLKTNYTHMMWIDADIEFTTEDVAKLWNMAVDVAVGIYPMKRPDKCWYAAWVDGKLVKNLDQFDGPIEVDFAGTGFMMIAREALESLIDKQPEAQYEGPNGKVYALYQTPVVGGHFDSEDYHFCRAWRKFGGKIFADPTVRLKHHGMFAYGSREFKL